VRIPSKEERKLFRDAMADVRPLRPDSMQATQATPRTRAASPARRAPPARRAVDLRRPGSHIDATLDLHGSTAEAARRRLQEFVADARAHGLCIVRIVHGKGLRSGAAGPVLESVVARTLRTLDDVESVEPARRVDGGAGAVIVRLRGLKRSRTR